LAVFGGIYAVKTGNFESFGGKLGGRPRNESVGLCKSGLGDHFV